MCDPRAQRIHARQREVVIELLGAEQHDPEGLRPDVALRQQADLLERLGRHRMRLVEQEDHRAAGVVELPEATAHAQRGVLGILAADLETHRVGQGVPDLIAREGRVATVENGELTAERSTDMTAQRRLAGARLADDLDDPALAAQYVQG